MNNNESNKDTLILFYHEQSQACQKLKGIIPSDKNIQMIDISKINNIPSSIKSIPSLIINNKEILSGKKVFDYFTKTDEIEYINFQTKNSSVYFSNLDDNNSSAESGGMYSLIDSPSMNEGVPEWDGEENNKTLDLDELQSKRSSLNIEYESVNKQ